MSTKLAGRSVRMFRCQIPPLIGGRSINAHMVKDLGWKAVVNDEATGIIVTTDYGSEHFVAFTNIQNTELNPEPKEASITEIKPRIGRPPNPMAPA